MHKETTPIKPQEFVANVLQKFNTRLEQLLSEDKEGLDAVRDSSKLEYLATVQAEAQEKVQECVRQYNGHISRLNNLGRGKRGQITVGAYTEKQTVYNRILENSAGIIIADVERSILNPVQNLKVA